MLVRVSGTLDRAGRSGVQFLHFQRKESPMSRFECSLLCAGVCLLAFGCAEKPASPGGEGGPGRGSDAEVTEVSKGNDSAVSVSPVAVPVATGDPRGAFLAAQGAMKRRDFGALFDLLSKGAQEKFHADLKADAAGSGGVSFVKDVLGFDPAEAARLLPREAFVKVMEGGTAASEKFAAGVGAEGEIVLQWPQAKVVDVRMGEETEGETATLAVEYENGSKGAVDLVLEDGEWKLAEAP